MCLCGAIVAEEYRDQNTLKQVVDKAVNSTHPPFSPPPELSKLTLSKRFLSKKRAVEVASKVSRLNAAANQQVSSSRLQRNLISTSPTAPSPSPRPSLFQKKSGDTCTIDIVPTCTIDIAPTCTCPTFTIDIVPTCTCPTSTIDIARMFIQPR